MPNLAENFNSDGDPPLCRTLLRPNVLAFLGYGALHQQYQNDERRRYNDTHPKDVEVGKRNGLLLPQVVQRLDAILQ